MSIAELSGVNWLLIGSVYSRHIQSEWELLLVVVQNNQIDLWEIPKEEEEWIIEYTIITSGIPTL